MEDTEEGTTKELGILDLEKEANEVYDSPYAVKQRRLLKENFFAAVEAIFMLHEHRIRELEKKIKDMERGK